VQQSGVRATAHFGLSTRVFRARVIFRFIG
jgi:hypothetical protein